jgi:hypothetical protein
VSVHEERACEINKIIRGRRMDRAWNKGLIMTYLANLSKPPRGIS